MTECDDKPVISKQRERRKFSRDDKRKLCKQWQASGLTKHKFCIQNDLVLSALNRWCQKFLCETSTKNSNWVPVVKPDKPGNTLQPVEIMLPNKMIVHVSLNLSYLKTLLEELCHATTVIR